EPQSLSYEAIGLIYFMLSRIEERAPARPDRYGRFRYGEAFSVGAGLYGTPLADVAARALADLIGGGHVVAPRTHYAVRLTHDVDRFRAYHRPLDPLRTAVGDVVKRGHIGKAVRSLRSYCGVEPWRSFRDIMDLSEAKGRRSHFYFMGPSRLEMDSPYALRWPNQVRAVSDEVARRGHAIGFHPGFATAADEVEWRRQKSGLENVIGGRLTEGRQHVLRYRIDATPEIWSDAGMDLDLTMGFPEAVGFRSGTCRRYPAYSLTRRRRLDVDRLDTALMDFGLFGGKYRDLPVDDALSEAKGVRDVCRAFGGELVILYHTGQSGGIERRFYEQLLNIV
ncbi:MAG: DUF7033 domain-containing protein, partial [Alphaproteobacteria bacterium]